MTAADFPVLHAVRLGGFADSERVTERAMLPGPAVEDTLRELESRGANSPSICIMPGSSVHHPLGSLWQVSVSVSVTSTSMPSRLSTTSWKPSKWTIM